MKDYIVLYADKKKEDNICLTNMFEHTKQIHIGWTEFDFSYNKKEIGSWVEKHPNGQIVFSGIETGWDKLIKWIKQEYPGITVKVICTTLDSLLYYEYERINFFCMLELSKQGYIDQIAFLRKGQYETYQSLGYSCSYLMENYILSENKKNQIKERENAKTISIGIYPLNYTWDKNIFNQLCVGRFIQNAEITYSSLDERMEEFLSKMDILSHPVIILPEESSLLPQIQQQDITMACSFTDYFHPVFWISMELGVPCLVGNHVDFIEKQEFSKYLITNSEDNSIINANKIQEILEKKGDIIKEYQKWKEEYNKLAQENKQAFLES